MRILLTGASGFIGGTTASHLRSQGHQVVGLYRTPPTDVTEEPFVVGSLGSEELVSQVQSQCEPCDAIVHAAACLGPDSRADELIRTNCRGTQQMLQLATDWQASSLVYLSSLPVIGFPSEHPITETHATGPRTIYHTTKLFGEHLLRAAAGPATRCASLRLSAPIGPGMPANRILSVFIRQALQGSPLLVQGQGTRRQNYVDVRDIARAIGQCLTNRADGVFNIVGATTISNLDLARTCTRVLASNSPVELTGSPDPTDNENWDASYAAAERAFGYVPEFDLTTSITTIARQLERSLINQCKPALT